MFNSNHIYLVQSDTGPQLIVSLTDDFTGNPMDLSNSGTTINFIMRAAGTTTIKETLVMGKLIGLQNTDGSVTTSPPYNVPGAGGRCAVNWSSTALNTAGEFEGEVQVNLNTGVTQTVYKTIKLTIRASF